MIIKVCGMRDAENIREVEALGVDWMGFIFYPRSSRYVGVKPGYLPVRCKRIGVTVNAAIDEVVGLVREYGLHVVQLHGDETPEYCRELKSLPLAPSKGEGGLKGEGHQTGVLLVKAIAVRGAEDVVAAKRFTGLVDYVLFDTRCEGYGGSGSQFGWDVLRAYEGPVPFLLSGGIGPDDVWRLSQFCHPFFAGIDLNSRFETAPGYKDIGKLKEFLNGLRQ